MGGGSCPDYDLFCQKEVCWAVITLDYGGGSSGGGGGAGRRSNDYVICEL